MSSDKTRYERGTALRRKVVGDEYVDRSTSNMTDFTRPLQELITNYVWGEVWSRPGLDLKTRSLLNVAMLSVLNRPDELRLHIGGALRNGCTKDEIRETLLQVAVYGGVPAALPAFRIAQEIVEPRQP